MEVGNMKATMARNGQFQHRSSFVAEMAMNMAAVKTPVALALVIHYQHNLLNHEREL